jgi:ribonuclease HI
MIRINRERYLKHIIIDLETLNKSSSTDFSMLGNYSYDSHFANFYPLLSDVPLTQKSEMVFQQKSSIPLEDTLFFQDPVLEITEQKIREQESNKKEEKGNCRSQIWTIYFDGFKLQEGSRVGCILIDPKGKHHFLSCRLEFECTNNTIEYEPLVQGLKKAIDLNVKELKVFGDSQIIVRQVRNTIHFNFPYLKSYQWEVHRLIKNFEAFNITTIPRANNILVDSLATNASRLSPLEDYEASRFNLELLYKPSVPNNISNWKLF